MSRGTKYMPIMPAKTNSPSSLLPVCFSFCIPLILVLETSHTSSGGNGSNDSSESVGTGMETKPKVR